MLSWRFVNSVIQSPCLAPGLIAGLLFLFGAASLPAQTNADCLQCHADQSLVVKDSLGKTRSLFVDLTIFKSSVHGQFGCSDCHTGISELPHAEKLPDVNCGSCHAVEAEVYQWHGREKLGEDPDLPRCESCHGTHDVFRSSSKKSKVNPLNLPQTCGKCHENINLIKKHKINRLVL